jgi:hypothetical protein
MKRPRRFRASGQFSQILLVIYPIPWYSHGYSHGCYPLVNDHIPITKIWSRSNQSGAPPHHRRWAGSWVTNVGSTPRCRAAVVSKAQGQLAGRFHKSYQGYKSVYPSIFLSNYLYFYLSIFLSLYLSFFLSFYLFI